MVNCSYCGEEVKRNIFCSPSHKVMFHQKPKFNLSKATRKILKEKIRKTEKKDKQELEPDSICPHARTRQFCPICGGDNHA